MIRLLIVDDQSVVRRGLCRRLALEADMTVVGEASNGSEAVSMLQQLTPEIVLMDIEMPELDGISATAMIRENSPNVKVVMLSIHDDMATRSRANAAGAAAFIHKNGAIEALIDAIRKTAEQKMAQSGSLGG